MAEGIGDVIRRIAARYQLDPDALLAVARGEGGLVNRANDIGDLSSGGSYGPYQLNARGALPSRYRGNPAAADAWAWSPEGIDYALRKMAEVGASGQTGAQAVNTIVRRFERPADPDTSVQNAVARLRAAGDRLGSLAAGAANPSGPGFTSPPAGSPLLPAGAAAPAGGDAADIRRRAVGSALVTRNLAMGSRSPQAALLQSLIASSLRAPDTSTVEPVDAPGAETGEPLSHPAFRLRGARSSRDFLKHLGASFGLPMAPVKAARMLGFPGQGTHSETEGPANWQSDSAWDFGVPEGSPVYATHDGRIGDRIGPLDATDSRFAGLRLYVTGDRGDEAYYAHLSKIAPGIRPGARVKAGQLVGYSGSANGVPHLHYALRRK